MNLSDFSGKKVGLLGAGMENLHLIPLLLKSGAEVTLCEQWESEVPEEYKDKIKLQLGDDHLSGLGNFDYIFRSPGLPIKKVVQALEGLKNQPIRTSAMDLFFSLGQGKTVGVTGTKGKGTTTTMIGSILKSANKNAIIAGNIGLVVFDVLDDIKEDTIVVVELSSFQLEDMTHSPDIAVLLPIIPDHLQPLSERSPNFHPSFDEYASAKANITAYQTPDNLLVYAADNKVAQGIADRSNARRIGVGENVGDVIVTSDGEVKTGEGGLINLKSTGLKGRHVFQDAALAATACRELGCSSEQIIKGLKAFEPLPHRLQTVLERDGITFVDDSYATAPDAAIAAIETFDCPIVWIGGGSRKGADFEELSEVIKNSRVKNVILLGEEADRLKTSIEKHGYDGPVTKASDIVSAVEGAKQFAKSGDVVLLSPACASKDMFKNAADRGDQFKEAVIRGKDGSSSV